MPRSVTLTGSNEAPIKADVSVRRAETLRLTMTPAETTMSLTISQTSGGDPIVEIPSEASGSFFILTPDKLSALSEGKKYRMNIWNVEDQDEPLLLVEGAFATSETIQPNYVQYATQVFEGATIVILTQAEYDALDPVDPEIVYVIVEE